MLSSVELKVNQGEGLAVVGETGCGKTVLARAVMRLLPPSAQVQGSVQWMGRELLGLDEESMRELRGKELAFLMQSPSSSLDPTMRVVNQLTEPFRYRLKMDEGQARARALEALAR